MAGGNADDGSDAPAKPLPLSANPPKPHFKVSRRLIIEVTSNSVTMTHLSWNTGFKVTLMAAEQAIDPSRALPVLADGYALVPAGKIASVVTCLQMFSKPALRVAPPLGAIRRVVHPGLDWYRRLFSAVGGEWLWFSRLRMSDAQLSQIVCDPKVWLYAIETPEGGAGLLELDFRVADECELAFFGLNAVLRGRGLGRALMNLAIETAFSQSIKRFWVHSCTLDHPDALAFYIRSGFKAYERRIEVATDPRLTQEASIDALPHVPVIGI
jgi:GNAT superfamily N-acetyltransferase